MLFTPPPAESQDHGNYAYTGQQLLYKIGCGHLRLWHSHYLHNIRLRFDWLCSKKKCPVCIIGGDPLAKDGMKKKKKWIYGCGHFKLYQNNYQLFCKCIYRRCGPIVSRESVIFANTAGETAAGRIILKLGGTCGNSDWYYYCLQSALWASRASKFCKWGDQCDDAAS